MEKQREGLHISTKHIYDKEEKNEIENMLLGRDRLLGNRYHHPHPQLSLVTAHIICILSFEYTSKAPTTRRGISLKTSPEAKLLKYILGYADKDLVITLKKLAGVCFSKSSQYAQIYRVCRANVHAKTRFR